MNANEKMIEFLSMRFFHLLLKNSVTNKVDAYYTDDAWSMDFLHPIGYVPNNICECFYILVVIDYLSKIGWTVPIQNKTTQTVKKNYLEKP